MSLRSFGLVSVVALALSFGCGMDRGSAAGAGGDAGSTGGSGGGDAGSICGNGVVEGEEECDDGNLEDADGCSPECKIQGTCDAPIDFWSVATATSDPEIIGVEDVPFSGHMESEWRGCAGGDQLVYRIVPEADGVVLVDFEPDLRGGERPVVWVRKGCSDPDSEVPYFGCMYGGGTHSVPVVAGEPVFLIVEASRDTSFRYSLGASFFPYRRQGETCDDDRFASRKPCASGLVCDDVASPGICVPNVAPVVDGAELLRGGPGGMDLSFRVWGSDANGNARAAAAVFYDADGEPMTIEGRPHHWSLGWWDAGSIGFGGWMRRASFFLDDDAPENATSADIMVTDTALLESAPVRVPIGIQPIVRLGESCDRDRFQNACEPGTICVREGGSCEDVAPLREAACASAPSIEVGVPLRFSQDVSIEHPPFPPHLWEVPFDCVHGRYKRQDFYRIDELVTQVARLSLDRELTNVVITLHDTFWVDPVLMLYPGCGTSDPPLVCMDDPPASKSKVPYLAFDSLPAGDYLVVVRPIGAAWGSSESWTLHVTADP